MNSDREMEGAPSWLKWTMTFINRIGFPIFAFMLMWYYSFVSLKRVQEAIEHNTAILTEAVEKNSGAIRDLRHFLQKRIDD